MSELGLIQQQRMNELHHLQQEAGVRSFLTEKLKFLAHGLTNVHWAAHIS